MMKNRPLGVWFGILASVLLASTGFAETLGGTGTWQSLNADAIRGKWDAQFVRQGNRIDGNIDLTGSNVVSGGKVSGEIDGAGVTFGVMVDGKQWATFSGKLRDGAIDGDWTFESDGLSDRGVWTGILGPEERSAEATKP